ncbi:uncharacterized protein LAESUDRAFT_712980 [Laetiporus sulphureus 93-53]|uniref:Uncharacterized protein n=1 Tax=Laetiporus sulphureus 93-53 TaxID=1314785 RepID=A0A165F6G7_9APHY|nr:uncharacterized protein LAESUDRAFT_712980 [Laetiporus sulphureus 93-53]KZT08485.1 hypothetical protein LAESUDRAFT_712980 [Laetiporus sulphureus 93-53]
MSKDEIQAIIENNIHLWPANKKYKPRRDTTKRVMINVILNLANGFRKGQDRSATVGASGENLPKDSNESDVEDSDGLEDVPNASYVPPETTFGCSPHPVEQDSSKGDNVLDILPREPQAHREVEPINDVPWTNQDPSGGFEDAQQAHFRDTEPAMTNSVAYAPQNWHSHDGLWSTDRSSIRHAEDQLKLHSNITNEFGAESGQRSLAPAHEIRQAVDIRIIDHREPDIPTMQSTLYLRCFVKGLSEYIEAEDLVETLQNSPCSIEGNARLAMLSDGDLEPFVKLSGLDVGVNRLCSRNALPLSFGRPLELHVLKLLKMDHVGGETLALSGEQFVRPSSKRKLSSEFAPRESKRVRQEWAEDRHTARADMTTFLEEAAAVFQHIKNVSTAASDTVFLESWQSFATTKGGKDLSDADIVKAYQFAFDFVQRWVGQAIWIKRDGRMYMMQIKKKHLHTVLDRDSSWFTPANKVVAALNEIGPHSAHPDEKVVERVTNDERGRGQDQLRILLFCRRTFRRHEARM